ncbi:hypothetical protein, partial [Klebsiella pneumoniae]|uniref:hypothetical protein n=1 Tax=Klebsiella pneumoniae TaxID=573 RepID=UPI0022EA89E1
QIFKFLVYRFLLVSKFLSLRFRFLGGLFVILLRLLSIEFSCCSLMVERPKDVQEYLDKLQDQVTLQSELNDRKRAQLRAEQDI